MKLPRFKPNQLACLIAVAVVPFLRIGGLCQAQSAAEFWQRQSIYQIITDRFSDGDPANNNAENNYNPGGSSGTSTHGGDFRGLEQKLDYIKALGATAVWISPVVLNANGEFHGYAGRDFYQVAPKFGSLADLQRAVQAAHDRGLLVINDVVVNHGGDLVYSTDSGYAAFRAPPQTYSLRYRSTSRTYAPPFNVAGTNTLATLFHNHGSIQDFNVTAQTELGELVGLDDFRTESPYVRLKMAEIYQWWITQASFDGFRLDTAKHVEMSFWQEWSPWLRTFAATNGKPNFFLFGEVYDGSDPKCGSYTGTRAGGAFALDSVVDYPLYFACKGVFASATTPTKTIEDRYSTLVENYDASARDRLVTFLDNHDQPRFLAPSQANNNTNRLRVALAFLYTSRGIPCLYYGTEQAFNGETDPNDREDMFDGAFEQGPSLGDNFNYTHPLFQWVARLNNLRRLYPALTSGVHHNSWVNPSSAGLLAYSRRLGTQEVFVVLNTATSAQVLPSRPTTYPVGTSLVNLLDPNEVITIQAGPVTPAITLPGHGTKIFIGSNQFRPLDPVVLSVSPSHDSQGSPRATPIVIQFSETMDTDAVASAFSTIPAVPGESTWNNTRDRLTFTPASTGFPSQTWVTVRLTTAAKAAAFTNSLIAPFESRFRTGTNSFVDLTPPSVAITNPVTGAYLEGPLVVGGTANDNDQLASVQIRLDDGGWIGASGLTRWSLQINSSNLLNGTRTLSARAVDAAGNVSVTNSLPIRLVNPPGNYLVRLSAGNAANVTDCAGNTWLKDQAYLPGSFGYLGGTAGYVASTLTGICAAEQSLYQRERYSTSSTGFSYLFDCPVGVYETTLLEAETWFSSAGQRIFSVSIEGQPVLVGFDILAAAGGKDVPISRAFTNSVSDGQLTVTFLPSVDNARASGVQVRKLGDLFSGGDGIPDWWRLAYFDQAVGSSTNASRGMDDADGDGANNLFEFHAGTDPLNRFSVFRISNAEVVGNSILISWPTRTNRFYQVQGRGLTQEAGAWTNVGTLVPGSNQAVTQSTSISPSGASFRVLSTVQP